jgi:hypothetical protein
MGIEARKLIAFPALLALALSAVVPAAAQDGKKSRPRGTPVL